MSALFDRGVAVRLVQRASPLQGRIDPSHGMAWVDRISARLRAEAPVLAAVIVLGLLAYMPLWTDILFTNHTLPNALLNPYPSFKTRDEGRWFADMLIRLAGGSGVQSLQFVLALGIKAINVQLLVLLFGLRRRWAVLAVAAVLTLHPAFLDYYAFTIDATTFELGDTLALLGTLALARLPGRVKGPAVAALCYVLSVAAYQPKLALCATLALLWTATAAGRGDRERGSEALFDAARAGGALLAAVVIYYVSIRVTVVPSAGERQHMNGLAHILGQAWRAYPEILADFTVRVDYIPRTLAALPALVILGGCVVAIGRARHMGAVALAVAATSVAALPIALQLCFIVNDQTPMNDGRILTPHAYLLAFGFIMLLRTRVTRVPAGLAAAVLAFLFFQLASQEINAAAMKSIFDQQKINRIVARIEAVTPELDGERPLVVIGELGMNPKRKFRRYPNQLYGSQFQTETFVAYRQAEFVNFYLGKSAVRGPSPAERAAAMTSLNGRRPWPAPESVWAAGNAIVVLLSPYGPGTPVTWSPADPTFSSDRAGGLPPSQVR